MKWLLGIVIFRTKVEEYVFSSSIFMKVLHIAAFTLLVVGGLNWGLSAFGYNLVNMILGSWPQVETVVYVLVGLSAIVEVATHKQNCKACVSPSAAPM